MARMRVRATSAAVAAAAAEEIARRARAAVDDHDSFTFAVSGGRSPSQMLTRLTDHAMPWSVTTIYQVDERIAPAGDPRRNLTGLMLALPDECRARVVPMPVEAVDLEVACRSYAAGLPATIDLIHLGLGSDGHTASLVPGDPVLDVADAQVALSETYQGLRRMTLTYPALARASCLVWLVTGADKRTALTQLLAADRAIPAGRLATDSDAEQIIFCDTSARPDRPRGNGPAASRSP